MNSTSREIRRLNIKSFFNRRAWPLALLPLLLKLLFAIWAASVCGTFDHLFVRLPVLCLEVCLLFVI